MRWGVVGGCVRWSCVHSYVFSLNMFLINIIQNGKE